MKRGKRIILLILGVFALLIAGTAIGFNIPYSPAQSEFAKLTSYQLTKMPTPNGMFTTEDISELPSPVQKHFQYC